MSSNEVIVEHSQTYELVYFNHKSHFHVAHEKLLPHRNCDNKFWLDLSKKQPQLSEMKWELNVTWKDRESTENCERRHYRFCYWCHTNSLWVFTLCLFLSHWNRKTVSHFAPHFERLKWKFLIRKTRDNAFTHLQHQFRFITIFTENCLQLCTAVSLSCWRWKWVLLLLFIVEKFLRISHKIWRNVR